MSVLGDEDVKEKNQSYAETEARDLKYGRSFGVFTGNDVHDVRVEWKLVGRPCAMSTGHTMQISTVIICPPMMKLWSCILKLLS